MASLILSNCFKRFLKSSILHSKWIKPDIQINPGLNCNPVCSISTSGFYANVYSQRNQNNGYLQTPIRYTFNQESGLPIMNLIQTRFANFTFQKKKNIHEHNFSSAKRIYKFGLEKRLQSVNGRKILFNKLLKGRTTHLTAFDRILPDLPSQKKNKKPKYKPPKHLKRKRFWKGIIPYVYAIDKTRF